MAKGKKAAPIKPSNRIEESTNNIFTEELTPLTPPYDPKRLLDVVEGTGVLSTSIESIVTNTDLRGHTYQPIIDLSAADIDEQIRTAIEFRDGISDNADLLRDIAKALGKKTTTVAEEKKRIATQMRRELFIMQSFFSSCNPKETFTKIREKTRVDLESTGNAYWEVLRDNSGRYQQINWIPAHTMRLCRTIAEPVKIQTRVTMSPVHTIDRTNIVQFRRFVQGYGTNQPVYFKEAGDPRLMSHLTGAIYEDEEALKKREGNTKAVPATEVIHFSIHHPSTPYGIPRWVGELININGIKSADITNKDYFDKKTFPPYVIKVMGGRVTDEDIEAVSQQLQDQLQGIGNFHKPLILQAQTAGLPMSGMAAPPSIDVEPLTKHAQTDGQFLNYVEVCNNRIGSSFRLPGMLRGDAKDMTRATANATIKYAEQHVFLPIRQAFDDILTKVILPNIGVYYHRFESKGPELTDPVELIQMLHKSSQDGYILPSEARNLAEQAYGVPFREVSEGWAHTPIILIQTGLAAKTHDIEGEPVEIEPPEETSQPPVSQDPSPNGKAPGRAPAGQEGATVTKSWVENRITEQVEEGVGLLTSEHLQELILALSPHFKTR